MKRIVKWTGIVLSGLIGLVLLMGLALYFIGMKNLTQTYPNITIETINIPADAEAIVHGKHVSIIWSCTKCHGDDLSGKLLTKDPIEGTIPILGIIPASNLTSGKVGIAESYTDTDWIRAIRHGVMPDGQVEIFMYDYSAMSDQDLGDLIAYLKQIPPVASDLPEMRYGPIIPIASAIGIFTPSAELIDHNALHPAVTVPGPTKEYGEYLSTICFKCHSTKLASNLENWKQEDFIRAIQTGVLPDGKQIGSTMSSKNFSEMNDMELSALWLYFQGLPSPKSQK